MFNVYCSPSLLAKTFYLNVFFYFLGPLFSNLKRIFKENWNIFNTLQCNSKVFTNTFSVCLSICTAINEVNILRMPWNSYWCSQCRIRYWKWRAKHFNSFTELLKRIPLCYGLSGKKCLPWILMILKYFKHVEIDIHRWLYYKSLSTE